MTTSITNQDIEKIKCLLKTTEEFISTNRIQDPLYADRYSYYWIKDPELTAKITKAIHEWKSLVLRLSDNKYTILHECTVTWDPDDEDTFVIAEAARNYL